MEDENIYTPSNSEPEVTNDVNTSPSEELPMQQETNQTVVDTEPIQSMSQTQLESPSQEVSQFQTDSQFQDTTQINPQPNINIQQPSEQPAQDQYARYAMPNGYWNSNQPYGFIGYAPIGFQNGMPVPPTPVKKPSKAKKVFGAVGLAFIFGLVAALVFITTVTLYRKFIVEPENNKPTTAQLHVNDKTDSENKLNLDPVIDSDKQIAPTVITDNVSTESTDISKVVDEVMPSIVSIDCTFKTTSMWGTYQSSGAGSGIILQKTDSELLIATNSHVINDALTIKVTFNNTKSFDATLKGKDRLADLAVIAIPLSDIDADTLAAIKVAKLGNSNEIRVGQMAIAIGNSLGYGQSVTVGYISAKDREVTVDGKKMILLQTDAAINPGNSGGALLNIKGEVIGINSVKYADSTVEGMGFAIPISRAFTILTDLSTREILSDEEKGYLGVYIENVAEGNSYNWPVGIYVSDLVEDGAAKAAGIYIGDIIVAVNGAKVTTTTELSERIQCFRHGTEVTLTIQRMNAGVFEEKEIKVVLSTNPTFTKDSDTKTEEPEVEPEEKPSDNNDGNAPDTQNPDNDNNNPYYYDPFGFDPFGFDPFDPYSFFNW